MKKLILTVASALVVGSLTTLNAQEAPKKTTEKKEEHKGEKKEEHKGEKKEEKKGEHKGEHKEKSETPKK